jgi:hypothetical protein
MTDRRVKEILLNCLYAICSEAPWEYGEAWVADQNDNLQLAVQKVGRQCQATAAEFVRRSVSLKLSPKASMPGSVMLARKRLFWNQENLIADVDRGQLIVASKFQCCLGLPVYTIKSSSFVGVLLLFSTTAVSPISNDNLEFAAAVADTAAIQVEDLNLFNQSIQISSGASSSEQLISMLNVSTSLGAVSTQLAANVEHPLFDAKHVVPVEVAVIVHATDANDVTPLKLSPSQTISKKFFRAAQMAKDKSIDWNSTLLSIQAILAKHASSSQESERQRVVEIFSVLYDAGSLNNLAACESIRLLLETLESFIFVSNSGANQAALPQRGSATELVSHSRKEMMKSITELTEMKNKAVSDLEASLQNKLYLEEKIEELESQLRRKAESGRVVKKGLLKATLEFHFDRLGVPAELQPKYSEASKRMQTNFSNIEDESTLHVDSDFNHSSSGHANDEYGILASRMSGPLSTRVAFIKESIAKKISFPPTEKFQTKASAHVKDIQEEIRRCNSELTDMKMLLLEVTGCLHGKLDILENNLQLHVGHKVGQQEAIFHFQAAAEILCREISEMHTHWRNVSSELQHLLKEVFAINGHEGSEIEVELDAFETISIGQKQSTAEHWVSFKKRVSSVLLTSVHRKIPMPSLILLLFSAFDFIYESLKVGFANAQSSIFPQAFDVPFFEFMNYRYAIPEIALSVCRDMFSILESLKSVKHLPNVFLNSFASNQFNFQWQYVLLFRKYYISHRSLSQPFVSTAEALKFMTVNMYAELNNSHLDPVLAKFLAWKKKNVIREGSFTSNDFIEFICYALSAGLEPRVERSRLYCEQNARTILSDELSYTQFECMCNALIIGSSRGSVSEHAQEHYGSIHSLQASGILVPIELLSHKLAIVQIAVLVDDAQISSHKADTSEQ